MIEKSLSSRLDQDIREFESLLKPVVDCTEGALASDPVHVEANEHVGLAPEHVRLAPHVNGDGPAASDSNDDDRFVYVHTCAVYFCTHTLVRICMHITLIVPYDTNAYTCLHARRD